MEKLREDGQLDVRELPTPETDALPVREHEAPESKIESAVAEIWAEVLQLTRIGRRDDFFALGGRSLQAVQVIARIRQLWGVEVGADLLFGHPVLRDFAEVVERAGQSKLPAITRVSRGERVPLSFAQQGLWFVAQMEGGSEAYYIQLQVRLKGELNREALRQALDRIVARHEALRTSFAMVDGEPEQRITAVDESRFQLLEEDLRGHLHGAGELQRVVAEESGKEFDLAAGPLIRGRLIQLAEQEHALLISMHHIVSDGWSVGVLFKELSVLYGAYGRGEEDPLPALGVQYADYAAWQRKWMEGEVLGEQAEYWKKNLEGAPEMLELPADRVRPARQDYAGAVLPVVLNEELTGGLKQLSARQGTTLYMTLLAAWAVLLARLSGQPDVVVGTPVANRQSLEVENLIGFFVNMVAVRVDTSGRARVGELLQRVKGQALAAQQHQDIPFEQVVELLQPVRSLAHSPLFQVTFTWLEGLKERPQLPGLKAGRLQLLPHRVSKFDMALLLQESGERIEGVVEYATALFEQATVERYLGYFTRLLEGMLAGDEQMVDGLPILRDEERQQVVHEWNDTEAEIPRGCVHELFEEQVERTPEAVALDYEGQQLTYAELNRRANRRAQYLRGWGVGAETRVGVCLERSPEMVVTMLGILKAGGVYVPLDAEYPEERLEWMMEDAAIGMVVTARRFVDVLPVGATQWVPVVCVDGEDGGLGAEEESAEGNVGVGVDGGQLAYVMYTSGSTGKPKGVMVTHGNVVRLVRNTNYVRFGPEKVIGHVSNVMFDASTFEIWGALLNGGRLAVIPKMDVLAAPEEFGGELKELGVTTLFLTTALFQECVRSRPGIFAGMEQVLFGGEACDGECVRRALEQEGLEEVVNVYGPTETTTFAAYYPVGGVEEGKGVPIGRPIGNTRIYIVDGEIEAVGVGVAGEICIGGKGVARGYLNQAGMTAERFVPDGFSSEVGERIYRTGDLGRWREDGAIEFVGRRDEQVKIRGHRIELGEVEAGLREQAGVKEAAAMVWVKENGDKQLVGYVVGKKAVSVTAGEVREGVRRKLPEYMVPALVVVLEELPLTANGKLDRKALPNPQEVLEERGSEYRAPRNRTEAMLAEVWAEALGLERVGIEENFFELGGDSILSVRITGRARRRGLEFSLQDLFEQQTIAALAQVTRWAGGEENIVTAPFALVGEEVRSRLGEDIEDAYPLGRLQAGMLFHSEYAPESGVYHDVICYRVQLPYEGEKFQRAVERLAERHEMLRTSIDMGGFSEPMQLVHRRVDLKVEAQDWRSKSAVEQEAELAEFVERECRTGFAWEQAPLLRIFVHWLSAEEFQYSLSFPHAIMDGWSEASLITELVQDYERRLAGETSEVKPLGVGYRDYIALERQALASEQSLAFWKQSLEGHTATPVPLRNWRPQQPGEPAGSGNPQVRMIAVSEQTQEQLRQLAREMGTPLKTVLLAAHMKALQVLSGQSDVTTGVVLNGRPEVEGGEQVIGLFLNTVPFRLNAGSESWRSLISETFAAEQQILPHRRYPMVDLKAQMGQEKLYETAFNYVHFHVRQQLQPDEQDGRTPVRGQGGHARTNLDLFVNFEVSADSGELRGIVHCDTGVLSPAAVERIVGYYERILAGMREDHIGDVRPEEEGAQIEQWNRTEAEIPQGCVHELFERQVERTPEAVAVECGGRKLSYWELNRRANQLARYLRTLGVGPDGRVAICLERRLELMVALLGVLKAGGAYVLLDPAYPAERLGYMLEDSASVVLLTQAEVEAVFAGVSESIVRVRLGDARAMWEQQLEGNLEAASLGLRPEHLAYVIYTSGSTGVPKGVAVQHQSLSNYLAWVNSTLLAGIKWLPATSSLSFDACLKQLFAPLVVGGTVILMGSMVEDSSHLLEVFSRGSSALNCVPLVWQHALEMLEKHPAHRYRNLVRLYLGGEQITPEVVRRSLEVVPQLQISNLYGPAESTANAVYAARVTPEDLAIGKPIANMQAYVLDGWMQPVQVGVAGEIYLGGAGLARGYWNRAELTAESFVPDPFASRAGQRLYRTGDHGKWRWDGKLEFVGRRDEQVKIRGIRVELGEIEAPLREHAGVQEAVVVVREDEPGEKRLVAYYTGKEGSEGDEVKAEQLRRYLSGKLPEYMVPAAYVRLERLPLMGSGKVDRKALPAPEADAYGMSRYEAPEGKIETAVAGIWAEVLKQERIGRQDNFFALGGHSLLAVRVVSRIRQALGKEVAIRDLFAQPVLRDFAGVVERARQSELPAITRASRGERVPLSFAQQRLWFLAQMGEGSRAYHMPFGVRLEGELNRGALRQALDRIVARHEALRTSFAVVDGEPEQRIAAVDESRFQLLEEDLREHEDAAGELQRVMAEESGKEFDLAAGPLIRGRLIQLAEQEHVLLISMHHIVSDGWSVGVLFKELSVLYGAYARGEEDPLPELGVQYADYAAWQRKWMEGEVLGEQAEYWKKNLEGAPEMLELPADRVRPGRQDYAGAAVPVVLNEELTRGLKELSARQGTTLYMTLLAAWAVLLARLSGQPDVVVGTPVANRGRVEVENLIGFFVNMVAVRVDVGERARVGELLQRVKGQALAAQQHQDIPFEQVVELLQPVRSLAHSPLFQVVFGWQDAVKHRPAIPGLQITPLHSSHVVSKFDLTLALEESGERIEGGVEYATGLFERATVERYLDYFTRLLEGMVAADEQMVNELLVLGEDEQRRLEYGRKANPKPAEYAERGYEAPLGEIETALAAIWRDLTGVDQVGRHDNFFELGGHSLLVTQLVLRIYQHFGVKIGISEVFEYAELSSLGAQVRQAQFAEFDSEEFANLMRDS